MKTSELRTGQIMQLDPEKAKPPFGGQFLVVTDPKVFGAQGYILWAHPMPEGVTRLLSTGRAYYRANWDEMEPTGGSVVWERKDE